LPKEFQPFVATPYHGDGKPVEGGAHTYPEMAAAGLWTTPTDLARYAIEVENSLEGKANHVLSAEMTRQMLVPGMGKWGLAWR
jgi:CubicO group peptidase (beta-lactamase class C family)